MLEFSVSQAQLPEMAAWGSLLLRGSAAAVRNNRIDASDEFLGLAEVAAVRAEGQTTDTYHQYWSTFSTATVKTKKAEALMIVHPSSP